MWKGKLKKVTHSFSCAAFHLSGHQFSYVCCAIPSLMLMFSPKWEGLSFGILLHISFMTVYHELPLQNLPIFLGNFLERVT